MIYFVQIIIAFLVDILHFVHFQLVPVIASSSERKSPESKSIEQLVVEQLKKIPFEIDLEKLLDDLKKKKKMKKHKKEKASRKETKKRREDPRRKKCSRYSSDDSDSS